jgi:predicted dehydrogenase
LTAGACSEPVRIAVVGLGYWGPNLVRVLYELPEAELAGVYDRDLGRAERIFRRYPDILRPSSYSALLDDKTVEAIAIATTVGTHFELARAALEAGKHVLVEKPMAASSQEALELIELAEAHGLTLMPGHTFLYSPPVDAVRDLIDSGELGDIYFVSSSRVNLGLHQPDVSVIWDLGPHDFSILRYWLDERPVSVSATTRNCVLTDVPDVAFVNLTFPSGTVANVELAWLAPAKLRRTVVVGSRKMVVYDDTSGEPIRIHDSGASLEDPTTFGEYRLTYRSGPILSPPIEATEPLVLELRDFCRAIREDVEPTSSARIGLEVVEMIEAVEQAVAEPRRPVRIGRPEHVAFAWGGAARMGLASPDR